MWETCRVIYQSFNVPQDEAKGERVLSHSSLCAAVPPQLTYSPELVVVVDRVQGWIRGRFLRVV